MVSFYSYLLVFFLFSINGTAQESSALGVLKKTYDFEIHKSEKSDGDLKISEWRKTKNAKPHLVQKQNSRGQLIEELEFSENFNSPTVVTKINPENHEIQKNYDFDHNGFYEKIEVIKIADGYRSVFIRNFDSATKREIKSQNYLLLLDELLTDEKLCKPSREALKRAAEISSFSKLFEKALVIGQKDSMLETSFGFNIDQKCLDKYGPEFLQIVQSSVGDGVACLNNMVGTGAQMNVSKIAALIDNRESPPKISCSNSNYEWRSSVIAHATIPGDVNHPQISLNPDRTMEPGKLKATILHELLHNCGHVHGSSPEYMYTCPQCCFESKAKYNYDFEKKSNDGACSICGGNNLDVLDKAYLKELVNWSLNDINVQAKNVLLAQVGQENQVDPDKIKLLIESLSEPYFNSTLYSEIHNEFSRDKKRDLLPTKTWTPNIVYSELKNSSIDFAKALRELADGRQAKAIEYLKSGSKKIPDEIASIKHLNDDRFRDQKDDLKKVYQGLIWSMHSKLAAEAATSSSSKVKANELFALYQELEKLK